MAYKAWRQAFVSQVAPHDQRQQARLWNLDNERRINKHLGQFRRRLGDRFDWHLRTDIGPGPAAHCALADALKELETVSSKWFGLLPVSATASVPTTVATYINSGKIRKRTATVFLSRGHPARRLRLRGPLKADLIAGGWAPGTRFIWLTFDAGSGLPSQTDPTLVKRELGLAHFPKGEFVYRFELTIEPTQTCYTPTCLDAGLYEAWKPPPQPWPHPWGLTRDLTDGQSRWPELLVETTDYRHITSPLGELVSPPGPAVPIGLLEEDFLIGRYNTGAHGFRSVATTRPPGLGRLPLAAPATRAARPAFGRPFRRRGAGAVHHPGC